MRFVVLTLGLVAALGAAAYAAPPVATPAAPVDPDTESARRHFRAGLAHYEAGRYEEAAAEFEQANRVKPLPDLEYNIGRAYDRLEKYDLAVEHYEKYLAGSVSANAVEQTEVRARVGTLRSRIAEQRQREAARADASIGASRPKPIYKKWWLWTAIGGVIVVGVGLGVGLGIGLSKPSAPETDLGTFRPQFP